MACRVCRRSIRRHGFELTRIPGRHHLTSTPINQSQYPINIHKQYACTSRFSNFNYAPFRSISPYATNRQHRQPSSTRRHPRRHCHHSSSNSITIGRPPRQRHVVAPFRPVIPADRTAMLHRLAVALIVFRPHARRRCHLSTIHRTVDGHARVPAPPTRRRRCRRHRLRCQHGASARSRRRRPRPPTDWRRSCTK